MRLAEFSDELCKNVLPDPHLAIRQAYDEEGDLRQLVDDLCCASTVLYKVSQEFKTAGHQAEVMDQKYSFPSVVLLRPKSGLHY